MEDYESILLVKPEVFVYRIPPRTTSRGYRAADWDLGNPNWTGRMRIVVKNKNCIVKLEDKLSGELFAQCPVDKYPGVAIEAVTDSSRYFILRIQDEGGKSAFIGLGFGDRSDSFDLNVALQDHFKWVQKEEDAEKDVDDKPSLDLGFKEGETIKINMKITKKDGQDNVPTTRPKKAAIGTGLGLLPPPPGGVKIPASESSPQKSFHSNIELLGSQISNPSISSSTSSSETWGDFASAQSPKSTREASGGGSTGWVTF